MCINIASASSCTGASQACRKAQSAVTCNAINLDSNNEGTCGPANLCATLSNPSKKSCEVTDQNTETLGSCMKGSNTEHPCPTSSLTTKSTCEAQNEGTNTVGKCSGKGICSHLITNENRCTGGPLCTGQTTKSTCISTLVSPGLPTTFCRWVHGCSETDDATGTRNH